MDISKRVILHRELIGQVRLAAEQKGWIPKGNLSIHTVEELAQMLSQIEAGIKPRVFKDVRRGRKPGWQDRRPATPRQVIKIYEITNLIGEQFSIEQVKSLTYAQAEELIRTLWGNYRDMEEEREGFDVGSTSG